MGLFLTVCLFLQSPSLESDGDQPQMRLRLWHDFSHPAVLDREAIAGWTLMPSELISYAADKFILGSEPQKQSVGGRLWRSLAAGAPLFVFELVNAGSSHETGHVRAASLAGLIHPEFVNEDDPTDRFKVTPFTTFKTQLRQVLGGDSYLITSGEKDWLEFWADSERAPHWREFFTLLEGDGLNQNQFNAQLIASKVMDGNAHPLDSISYFVNLTATALYDRDEENDIKDYIELLEMRGIRARKSEVRVWSQIPKLFSNSTLTLFGSVINYWANGEKEVQPIRCHQIGNYRFYWPEFVGWLTLFGPTVQVAERVDWDSLAGRFTYTFSFERSLSENISEIGFASKGPSAGWLSAEFAVFHNLNEGGTWLEGGPILKLCSWLSVGIKAYYGRGYSFHREMVGHIPHFMEKGESGIKGFIGVAFPY